MGVSIKLGRRVASLSTSFLPLRERLWERNGSLPWRGKIFSQAMILGSAQTISGPKTFSQALKLKCWSLMLYPRFILIIIAQGHTFYIWKLLTQGNQLFFMRSRTGRPFIQHVSPPFFPPWVWQSKWDVDWAMIAVRRLACLARSFTPPSVPPSTSHLKVWRMSIQLDFALNM